MSVLCGVSAEIEDYSLEDEERVEGEHDRVCVREVTLIPAKRREEGRPWSIFLLFMNETVTK